MEVDSAGEEGVLRYVYTVPDAEGEGTRGFGMEFSTCRDGREEGRGLTTAKIETTVYTGHQGNGIEMEIGQHYQGNRVEMRYAEFVHAILVV